MTNRFNMLRSNDCDLALHHQHYMRGQSSEPVHLLYWNSDATRMPGGSCFYYACISTTRWSKASMSIAVILLI